jgi:hypothetical protein
MGRVGVPAWRSGSAPFGASTTPREGTMTKRMLVMGLVVAALVVAANCKKDDGKQAVKKFHADFAALHEDGVKEGFFQCLYGEPNLPGESGEFIEQIKRRFDSDPAGFIQEKSEGCRTVLEATTDKVRLMTAPTVELGTARDAYTDAATAMADAWTKVHQAFVDFKTVDDARIEFNGTYAPLLEKAGNRGWAVIQKFEKPE